MNPRNIKEHILCLPSHRTSLTAGGTGDNTAVSVVLYDRERLPMRVFSLMVAVFVTATLAATKTFTGTFLIVTSASSDLSSPTTLATSGAITLTGPSGGDTLYKILNLCVDLTQAKRYVGITYTPDLNAADTDTATVDVASVFGGFESQPDHDTILAAEKAALEA
jgi:hypothetical protein